MKKFLALAAVAPLALAAMPASAAVIFTSTFENVPGGPTSDGTFTTVNTADGWTGTNGIELQRRAAGNPAPNGGNVFVELDTSGNSSMSRTIGAGSYDLSFLYSPRPSVGLESNVIEVLLNGVVIGGTSALGGAQTAWSSIVLPTFTATAGSVLTFRAAGTSDSLGGYIDNITLSGTGVPEPATWGLMILGFGAIGGLLRRRRTSAAAIA